MNDSAQLIQIIKDVLQPNDPALRKNSEALLTTLRNEKPNELIVAYLNILKRIFCVIQPKIPSNAETSLPPNFVSASQTLLLPLTQMFGTNCFHRSSKPSKSDSLR